MSDGSSTPPPDGLIALSTAYWGSQVLLTASRLGAFEAMAQEHHSVAALAGALGTAERPTRLLLNALVALELAERHDDGYHNAPAAAAYLVPGKPTYLGQALRYGEDMYQSWGELERALREDAPVLDSSSYLGADESRTGHFVRGMRERALVVAQGLVPLVDLDGRTRLLDVGGGPGTYAAQFARRYPALRATVFDLPGVVAIADELLAEMGVAERVATVAGDYHVDPLPSGNDAVLMSGTFHRESEAGCRALIARGHDSLEDGGLLVVSDVFTDAGGAAPAMAALFGLNMLLCAPHGGVHSHEDVAAWMHEAGFDVLQVSSLPPPMPHRVIVARKGRGS